MINEAEAKVTVTIRATLKVAFLDTERERPITKSDAIEAAIGSLPGNVIALLEGEGFEVADPEGEVLTFAYYEIDKYGKWQEV